MLKITGIWIGIFGFNVSEIFGFLMFSGGIEMERWIKIV